MSNIKVPMRLHSLTPIQKKLLYDNEHRFFVVPSGRRSRKTLISMRKVLYAALENKNHRYFHGAPVRAQAKDIFWDRLKQSTRLFWAKPPSETELVVHLLNGTEIHVEGLDKSERIEGQPWNGCHITEFGDLKPDAWPEHIRPVLSDTMGFGILDGVPEGRNHYYDHALFACNGIIPQTLPSIGAFAENQEWSYYHWFSSDVLSAAEIEAVKQQLDQRTFEQEYEGAFLSFEGLLYYNFDRSINVNDTLAKHNPERPIYLSCDFNKTPMVWLAGHLVGKYGVLFDEIEASFNAKTQQAAQLFCDRYQPEKNNVVYITGDASGNHESIRDFTTDYIIIQDILQANGWHCIFDVPNANPSVNNRVNLVCSMFRNISGEARLFLNSKCARTINDMERNTSDGKGAKDKTDPHQTHGSDCLDYQAWKWWSNEFYKNGVTQQ
jgi:hypothetical protein